MPRDDETTTRFRVDISELKSQFQDAQRQIRLANSEFKAATSGMDKWTDSADGLTAKIKQLNDVMKAEKDKLQSLEKQYELAVEQQGANSRAAEDLQIKINNQKAAIGDAEKQIDRYNGMLTQMTTTSEEAADNQDQVRTAMSSLKDTISNQESELSRLKDEYANVVLEQGNSSEAAQDLAGQIDSLSSELQDNRDTLADAEDAADEFDNTLNDLGEDSGNASGGFTVMKGALADLVSNGIQMAIGALKDFVGESINTGKEFDSSMSNVAALSGATGDELQMLRDTAKEYGSTTMFSATQAADALGYMALAGWDANQSASALGGVLDLAAASNMDLADASDMVTDYMSAFSMQADESSYFADVLAYAQAHANTTAEGLGEAFKNCAANMNASGQDFETTTSLLSMMANQGLKGSEAGTALTAVMRDMTAKMGVYSKESSIAMAAQNGFVSSTGDLNDLLGKSAITIGDTIIPVSDATGAYRDMTDILFDVENAVGDMGDAERAAALSSVFTSDSIKGLNLILNAGVGEAANFEDNLRAASVTTNGFETAAKNAGLPLDEFKNRLEEAGVSNEDFTDALKDTRGDAELFADYMNEAAHSGYNVYDIMDDLGISLDDLQSAMDNSTGSAKEMADAMQDNLGGDLTSLGSQFEGVQIAMYEKFEPALRKGVDILSKLLNVVSFVIDHSSEFVTALTVMATAIGTYLAYTTAMKIMQDGWKSLTIVTQAQTIAQGALNAVMSLNPIGLVIAAIAGLVAAFVILWKKSEGFRNFWIGLWEEIQNTVSVYIEAIATFFSNLWDGIKSVWETVSTWFNDNVIQPVKEFFSGLTSAIGQFFSDAWNKIVSVWTAVSTWFSTNVIEPIKTFFAPLVEWFTALFTEIWNFIKSVFEVIAQLAEGCVKLIQAIWSVVSEWFNENVIKPLTTFFTILWNIISKAAKTTWDAIVKIWTIVSNWFNTNVIKPVKKFFTDLWNAISTAAKNTWSKIKDIWNAVSGWFDRTVISPVKKVFTGLWDGLKKGASDAWSGIKKVFSTVATFFKDIFTDAWTKVKDVFSTGGKIFDGIKDGIVDAFKTIVNGIIRGINKVVAVPFNAINKVLGKIRDVSIAGVEPFSGLISTIDVPEIPELAKGGVLKKGQVGFLEGDGDEAVVPLQKNTGWIDEVAKRVANHLDTNTSFGNTTENITNNYNFNQTNNSPKSLSRLEIYRQSKNLLAAKGV